MSEKQDQDIDQNIDQEINEEREEENQETYVPTPGYRAWTTALFGGALFAFVALYLWFLIQGTLGYVTYLPFFLASFAVPWVMVRMLGRTQPILLPFSLAYGVLIFFLGAGGAHLMELAPQLTWFGAFSAIAQQEEMISLTMVHLFSSQRNIILLILDWAFVILGSFLYLALPMIKSETWEKIKTAARRLPEENKG